MKIDDNWNLILPVDDSIQVFHTPISQNVFEVNHKLITGASLTKCLIRSLRIAMPAWSS